MFKADDFWQFSLQLYACEGVKDLCLALQDEHGFNVNLLLLCCFLHHHGVVCSESHVSQLRSAIEALERETIEHRGKRRASKLVDKIRYQQLLRQELQMEKAQQQLLIDTLNQIPFSQAQGNNLEVYARALNKESDAPVLEALAGLMLFAENKPLPSSAD